MNRGFAFLAGLLLLSLNGCAMMHSVSQAHANRSAREHDARTAALQWLKLLDSGDYAAAYDEESDRPKAAATERQFVRSMQGRRVPFGRTRSRVFIGAAFARKLIGAPDGHYESILFKTSFSHKALAAERVILTRESGHWRVVDYRIY